MHLRLGETDTEQKEMNHANNLYWNKAWAVNSTMGI